jgi:hypothetical protein
MKNTVDEFIENKVDKKHVSIIDNFRKLISTEFPQLKEEMRGGTETYYSVPVYRLNRIIITISPTKKGITFSFSDGKKFEDNYSLLEGVGNKTLNIRISKPEDYDNDIMRYYVKQAIHFDTKI